MLTQRMCDRRTLEVHYPLLDRKGPAGAVDPATQQLDFFIRSPETDERNKPTRRVFDHFFAMKSPGNEKHCLSLESRPQTR